MEQLELYIPKLEDLWFYQKMMSDPETMSYNAGWDVDYDGYHWDTGCIDYSEEMLSEFYEHFIVGQEPQRFYAYIKRSSDGAWIGDVNFHYTSEKDWWDMGIVIYAPYRGKGYAVPALKLMLEHAFRDCGISRIHNDFEVARNEVAAWETHRKAGFKELGVEDGFLQMMITKEEYLKKMSDFSRTEMLIGKDSITTLNNARVLVCGVGGVGGYAVEALARGGVGNIAVLDSDDIHPSNLNRQILATVDTVGRKKVEVCKERILTINPDCNVTTYDMFYLPENADSLPLDSYDFIIDAVDTVSAKLELITRAKKARVPIVSCMGTGNKLGYSFEIADIKKTSVCPLAKVMRKELKARGIDAVPVLYSKEEPITPQSPVVEGVRHIPGSLSYPPAIAGLMLGGYVIRAIIQK